MVYTFKPAPVDYFQCCQLYAITSQKDKTFCTHKSMTKKFQFDLEKSQIPFLANDFETDFEPFVRLATLIVIQFVLKIVLFTNIFQKPFSISQLIDARTYFLFFSTGNLR